jgi:hypothetical protein
MVSTLARSLGCAVTVVGGIAAGRGLLGRWPTAVLLAAGCLWWGLRAWQRFEGRPRRSRALVPVVVRLPGRRPASGHVDFARALAAVAIRYLDECEQEARP